MAEEKARIAPHSKESEMMVLGCMLTSVNALNIAADALDENDFYFPEHKVVFQSLKELYRKDKPADVHIISEELKRTGKLQTVGGVAYVSALAQYAGTSAYIEEYAKIVKNKSVLRRMINAAQSIEKRALEEPQNVDGALDDAQALFFKISQAANPAAGVEVKDILTGLRSESAQPFLTELQEKQEYFNKHGAQKASILGVPTHLIDLDRLINGLGKSNLILLAARPSMGKTALAMNIAENVCFVEEKPVGIFSLEMSADQLLQRMIASQAQVESEKIKTGSLNGEEYQRIVEAVSRMQRHTMVIDDQPGLKVTDLRARARRMKEIYGVELIVIDYLQLLSGSGNHNGDNRQQEISDISRNLKNLAREINIPILCLSQLSRKVEERPDKRPWMSDLRESGSLEQDSDVILLLYRAEYYDKNTQPGLAKVYVVKNRHGATGEIDLVYRKHIVQFANAQVHKAKRPELEEDHYKEFTTV